MEDKKIRTAVVGAGKMGGIHAKVYSQLPDSQLVAVVDADKARASQLAEKYGCTAYTDCAEILDKVDAVTIATPTTTHLEVAKLFLCHKIPVLVEKPLASSVREGRKIVSLARRYDTVVAVGHSERCNPVAQAMKRLDIEPKFIEAQRVSPYPFRSTDVGVVLDIMIHDIDIILSLARSKIKRVDAVGVTVIEGGEDICNARIVFENGCIANLTGSRLALKTERRVRVFSREAYVNVDYLKKSGIVIKTDPNKNVVDMIQPVASARRFQSDQRELARPAAHRAAGDRRQGTHPSRAGGVSAGRQGPVLGPGSQRRGGFGRPQVRPEDPPRRQEAQVGLRGKDDC